MAAFDTQHVLSVHHWNDTLFSFTTTRGSLRFESGQFVMIGIEVDGRPLMRAYSIASPHYAEHLEFFSIKVPDGALTSRLQHLRVGDPVLVGRKPTRTLVPSDLRPGRHLHFDKVVLVHGVRETSELAYANLIEHELPRDEFLGDAVRDKLIYFPTVTREAFRSQGRLPALIESGALCDKLRLPPLDPALDRLGFKVSAGLGQAGDYVIERAFVER